MHTVTSKVENLAQVLPVSCSCQWSSFLE